MRPWSIWAWWGWPQESGRRHSTHALRARTNAWRIRFAPNGEDIDLEINVIIEYGIRVLASVAESVANMSAFMWEKALGLQRPIVSASTWRIARQLHGFRKGDGLWLKITARVGKNYVKGIRWSRL